jgi:hypothetical protein
MNPNVARLFVDALRSGEYVEAPDGHRRMFLKCVAFLQEPGPKTIYHNPLGILLDLFMWETGRGEWVNIKDQLPFAFVLDWDQCHSSNGFLPEVYEWAGARTRRIKIPVAGMEWFEREVTTIWVGDESIYQAFNPGNDWDQLNLKDLADLIEKEYCNEP